jgi:acyl carrier protein
MSSDTFVRNFESAIEGIPPNSLTATTEFRGLEKWDSLAALAILAMVDAEYSVQITGNELKGCNTINDIFAIVSKKTGS